MKAISTIPQAEYNRLLAEAVQRMCEKLGRLADEEESKSRMAEKIGNKEVADKYALKYNFNSRALLMAQTLLQEQLTKLN